MQANSSHRWKTEHLLLIDLTCTVEYHPSWSLSESPWNHPGWTLSSLDLPPTQGAGLVTSHDDMRFFRRPGDPENYCKPSFATIWHSVKKEQSAAKGENATGILGAGVDPIDACHFSCVAVDCLDSSVAVRFSIAWRWWRGAFTNFVAWSVVAWRWKNQQKISAVTFH